MLCFVSLCVVLCACFILISCFRGFDTFCDFRLAHCAKSCCAKRACSSNLERVSWHWKRWKRWKRPSEMSWNVWGLALPFAALTIPSVFLAHDMPLHIQKIPGKDTTNKPMRHKTGERVRIHVAHSALLWVRLRFWLTSVHCTSRPSLLPIPASCSWFSDFELKKSPTLLKWWGKKHDTHTQHTRQTSRKWRSASVCIHSFLLQVKSFRLHGQMGAKNIPASTCLVNSWLHSFESFWVWAPKFCFSILGLVVLRLSQCTAAFSVPCTYSACKAWRVHRKIEHIWTSIQRKWHDMVRHGATCELSTCTGIGINLHLKSKDMASFSALDLQAVLRALKKKPYRGDTSVVDVSWCFHDVSEFCILRFSRWVLPYVAIVCMRYLWMAMCATCAKMCMQW
jgi:hypothetical protein